MKKVIGQENAFLIFALCALLFLGVTQVSASQDNSNRFEKEKVRSSQIAETSPTPSIQAEEVEEEDCDDDTRNHGAYVSCIARKHDGGESVSIAARSDIGKKHDDDDIDDDDDDDITPTVQPSTSPTASPSVSPTISPSITVTPNPSETPTVTPSVTVTPQTESAELRNELKSLIDSIRELISAIKFAFHL